MSLPGDLKKLISKYKGKRHHYYELHSDYHFVLRILDPMKTVIGLERAYFTSGQLWEEIFFINGKRTGILRGWYERQDDEDRLQLQYKNYYKNRVLGKHKSWYPNGEILEEGQSNKTFKIWYKFYRGRKQIREESDENGYLIRWHKNGEVVSKDDETDIEKWEGDDDS